MAKQNQTPADGEPKAGVETGQSLHSDPNQEPAAGELNKPNDSPPPPEKEEQVRVICEGYLGTQLLKKGDVTSDPEYVAILEESGQQKVEAVK